MHTLDTLSWSFSCCNDDVDEVDEDEDEDESVVDAYRNSPMPLSPFPVLLLLFVDLVS